MRLWLTFLFIFSVSAPAAVKAKRLVIIGDSLTEGYGISKDNAYPALLEKKIKASGKDWTVINAGISGSTSASGPSRMAWQLKSKPDLILLALGANDGLRGQPVAEMEKNLGAALVLAQQEKVPVLLAGMRLPPNYGEAYTKDFSAAFSRVSDKYKVPFLPFILSGVGGVLELNQSDRIHPNEKGHAIVGETVFNFIKPHL